MLSNLSKFHNRQQPSEAEVDFNRSLMELSLHNDDDEPTIRCTCKGMCKRACPCSKESVKCGPDCKCKKNKCVNQKEEVRTVNQGSGTKYNVTMLFCLFLLGQNTALFYNIYFFKETKKFVKPFQYLDIITINLSMIHTLKDYRGWIPN